MAEFKSRFNELGFYVAGSLRRFKNGVYFTDSKREIEALEKVSGVVRVDIPGASKPKEKTEEKKKTATPRKPSAD